MNDHVHNQLCARIEELEAEKMELNEQLDVAQQEREVLSAHVERLQGAIRSAISSDWSVPAEEALGEAIDDKAAARLARLKAQWQAEALEDLAQANSRELIHPQIVMDLASEIRRQVGGGESC